MGKFKVNISLTGYVVAEDEEKVIEWLEHNSSMFFSTADKNIEEIKEVDKLPSQV